MACGFLLNNSEGDGTTPDGTEGMQVPKEAHTAICCGYYSSLYKQLVILDVDSHRQK